MQATSDFSKIDQVVSEKSTGASYGNAFLAALAVGAVAESDITRWNPAITTIKTKHSVLHAEKNKLFRQLYEDSKEIAHAVADST
jgi:xylulokinase